MDIASVVQKLTQRQPPAPLFPTQIWKPELSGAIQNLDAPDAVRAGLLLWNDDLEASHTLSQGIESQTGSLWHAVMHRREGDASNSIYWWHKTGEHPAFDELYPRATELLKSESHGDVQAFLAASQRTGTWLPIDFVRACEPGAAWCVRMQHEEFAVFLKWCIKNV